MAEISVSSSFYFGYFTNLYSEKMARRAYLLRKRVRIIDKTAAIKMTSRIKYVII